VENKKLKIALSLFSLALAGLVAHHSTRAILRAQAESANPIVPKVALTHSFTETVTRSKGGPIVAKTTIARKFDGSSAELIDLDGNGMHNQTLMITDAQHGYMTNVDFASKIFIRRPISRQHAAGLKWAKGSRDAVYATKPNATFSPAPAFQGHPAFLVTYQRTVDGSVFSTQETALDDANFLTVESHETQVNSKNGTWAKVDRVTTLLQYGEPSEDLFKVPEGFKEANSYSEYWEVYRSAREYRIPDIPAAHVAFRNAVWANAKIAGPLYDDTVVNVNPPITNPSQ
jgi:hypothetical protein